MSKSSSNLVKDFEDFSLKGSKSNSSFKYSDDTSSEFFAGNLNKYKTRDELFHDLTNIYIECLQENLYIKKFNMPKFTARKEGNKYVCNPGYAFVTARRPEMAAELIERCRKLKLEGEKGIPLGDGSFVDIKPISAVKRVAANQNNKTNSLAKLSGGKIRKQYQTRNNSRDWVSRDDNEEPDNRKNDSVFDDWQTFKGNSIFPNADFPSLQFNTSRIYAKSPIKKDESGSSIFNFSNYGQINQSTNYFKQMSSSSSDPKSPIEAHG